MKKNLATAIGIVSIVGVLATGLSSNYQIAQLRTELENQKAAGTPITRVVNIYKDGKGGAQTLSLTSQEWLDFMRTYPDEGAMISNLDFEDLFSFSKIDNWYSDEVKEFLAAEKTPFISWTPVEGYDGDIYGNDFVVYYNEYRDGIKFLFDNPEDKTQVEFEIAGAKHAKGIYTGAGHDSLYYLVFEDKDGRTLAINTRMEMFQLSPITV